MRKATGKGIYTAMNRLATLALLVALVLSPLGMAQAHGFAHVVMDAVPADAPCHPDGADAQPCDDGPSCPCPPALWLPPVPRMVVPAPPDGTPDPRLIQPMAGHDQDPESPPPRA